jgi:hypothetical protein
MLVQDVEPEQIGPPVTIGRAAASGVLDWAFGFGCHENLLLGRILSS